MFPGLMGLLPRNNTTNVPGGLMPTPGGQLQTFQPQPYSDIEAQRAQIQQMLAEAQASGVNPWPSVFQSISGLVQMGAGIASLSAGKQRGPAYTIAGIGQIGEGIGSLAGTMATREQQAAQKQDQISTLLNANVNLGNLEQNRRQLDYNKQHDKQVADRQLGEFALDLRKEGADNKTVNRLLGQSIGGLTGQAPEGDVFKQDFSKAEGEIKGVFIPVMAESISLSGGSAAERKRIFEGLQAGVMEAYPDLPPEVLEPLLATAKYVADATPLNLQWRQMLREDRNMTGPMLDDENIVTSTIIEYMRKYPGVPTAQIIERARKESPVFDVTYQKYAGMFTNGNSDRGGRAVEKATDFFMNSTEGFMLTQKLAQAKTPEEKEAAQREIILGIRELLPVYSINEMLADEARAKAQFDEQLAKDLEGVLNANPGMTPEAAFEKLKATNPTYQALYPSAPAADSLVPKDTAPQPTTYKEYLDTKKKETEANRAQLGRTLGTVAAPVTEMLGAANDLANPKPNTLLGRAAAHAKQKKQEKGLVMDTIPVKAPTPGEWTPDYIEAQKKKKKR